MDQNLNPQTLQATTQNQISKKRTVFIIVGVVALVIALILDFNNDRQTYINPYQYWVFAGDVLIYILEIYVLYGLLKLFKILDTSFSSRVILVGLSSLAFDIMQYFFLPKVGSGDVVALSISLIVFLVIIFSLIKDIYKTTFGKTLGLSISFLVTIFLVSGLIVLLMSKMIS